MRNLKLVDAVVALHEIANLVGDEIGVTQLHADIIRCANQLHEFSLIDARASGVVDQIIKQAKE